MFKKTLSIILAILIVLSTVGCSTAPAANENDSNNTTSGSDDNVSGNQGFLTDENFLTVDLTLPASMFNGQDMTNFDTEAYAKEQGYISAKINEDGSMTITMLKSKQKELLKEMADSLDKSFAELVNSTDTPYIKAIEHNNEFTQFTIKVDRDAYNNSFDMTPFAISLAVAVYHAFTEIEYHVEVKVVDADRGHTINTFTYPQAES